MKKPVSIIAMSLLGAASYAQLINTHKVSHLKITIFSILAAQEGIGDWVSTRYRD